MTDPRIRCQILLLLAALLVALLAPLAAAADVIDYVNSVRRHGCGGHAGALVPLRESTRLDEVARQLAQGAELRAAQQLAGYHAASAFSVQISGVPPSGDVGRVIARQYCEQSTNPAFREIGTFQRGADVWLPLAGNRREPRERHHDARGRGGRVAPQPRALRQPHGSGLPSHGRGVCREPAPRGGRLLGAGVRRAALTGKRCYRRRSSPALTSR